MGEFWSPRTDTGRPLCRGQAASGNGAVAVASGLATDLKGAYAIEDQLSREILRGPEAAEGSRAFAEKRPPSWRLT